MLNTEAAVGATNEADGVRPLDLDSDAAALDALWELTLGSVWPLEPGRIASVATGGLVVDGDNALDAAAVVNGSALVALLVAPHRQRRGLGTALLSSTWPASIGSGGDKYLWPGVPTNLPGALQFFDRAGWRQAHLAWDYCAELDRYSPPAVEATPGLRYLRSSIERHDDVVDFNRRNFPQWARHFERLPPGCAVVAMDDADRVVASLLTEWKGSVIPGRGDDSSARTSARSERSGSIPACSAAGSVLPWWSTPPKTFNRLESPCVMSVGWCARPSM